MRERYETRRKFSFSAAIVTTLAALIPLVIVVAATGRAQSAAAVRPQFEVASVKPDTKENGHVDFLPVRTGDRVVMHNTQLQGIVMYAYHVAYNQLAGFRENPDSWKWYDIDARVAGSPSDPELRLMFQSMLEDRFKLKVHRETREMPVYKLEVAKGGPKLKPGTEGDSSATIEGRPLVTKNGAVWITMWKDGSHLVGKNVTMAQLASALSSQFDGPLVESTGIAGTFDFDVIFAPANWPPDSEFTPPFLSVALKNELGLTVEKGKAPVEVLVLDHLEKPTPN
jgi:uncharacterized protein (TIGR03435 family)